MLQMMLYRKKLFREKREATNKEDPFEGIDDTIFTNIEAELFSHIDQLIEAFLLTLFVMIQQTFLLILKSPKDQKLQIHVTVKIQKII